MDVTIVGSGTVVPSADRVCSAYHVTTGAADILLDCGAGALHHLARFGLPWSRLTHLALTHFHADHIGDVPILFFSLKHGLAQPRSAPLSVIGPIGTRALFRRLADAFGEYLVDPGFPVEFHESVGGAVIEIDDETRVSTHATPHTEASLAYRLDRDAVGLGYTGDTGPSAELGAFMHGVDLLIAECSLPDPLAIPSHLSPSGTADLARRAEPRTLVVTHVYPQLDRGMLPSLLRRAGWRGNVVVAEDGSRYSLSR